MSQAGIAHCSLLASDERIVHDWLRQMPEHPGHPRLDERGMEKACDCLRDWSPAHGQVFHGEPIGLYV